MMPIAKSVVAFAVAAFTAGCANMMSIDRKTYLPKPLNGKDNTTQPDYGSAIHLDAQQRLVITNGKGITCSEPSPDALQSLASSLGASLSLPAEKAASLTSALTGNTGSIGLRTQSITLMREELFRICEAYQNDAITKEHFLNMLQRSQDLTLGILAIEQLTGAVAAKQIGFSGGSDASAAANLNNTRDELDVAKAAEAEAKKAMDESSAALTIAKESVTQAEKSEEKVRKPVAADVERYKKLQADRPGQEESVNVVKTALADAEKAVLQSTEKRDQAKKEHDAADSDKKKALKEKLDQLERELATEQAKKSDAVQKKKEADDALRKTDTEIADIEKKPGIAEWKKAQVAIDNANIKKIAAEATLSSATKDHEDAKKVTKAIEESLNKAVARTSGKTEQTAKFDGGRTQSNIQKDTVAEIAKATREIVDLVLSRARLTDMCHQIYLKAVYDTESKVRIPDGIGKLCAKVVEANILRFLGVTGTVVLDDESSAIVIPARPVANAGAANTVQPHATLSTQLPSDARSKFLDGLGPAKMNALRVGEFGKKIDLPFVRQPKK